MLSRSHNNDCHIWFMEQIKKEEGLVLSLFSFRDKTMAYYERNT